MDKLIDLESVKQLVIDTVKESALTDEEIAECGAACGCGATTATTSADLGQEIQYLGATKKDDKESALEEDEVNEMARGVLAPQEQAKREYISEYPESGINTADQFMRKVILNPEATGYKKYIKRFAYLIRNVSSESAFSSIAADIQLDNEDGSDDTKLATDYANAVLGHRKSMSKSSYDSKGLINAYQRDIIKRGPYYKPGKELVQQAVKSVGQNISDKYNEVDPSQSNKVLATFFKSADWKNLTAGEKSRALNVIEDQADLDEIGCNLINKQRDLIANEDAE